MVPGGEIVGAKSAGLRLQVGAPLTSIRSSHSPFFAETLLARSLLRHATFTPLPGLLRWAHRLQWWDELSEFPQTVGR